MKKVYFPNLDGVRFFASLLVIVAHFEQKKATYGIINYFHIDAVRSLGQLGVSLFFVLSGFLITFLLYVEKEKNQRINIYYFYFRRILRIWPLYFLIVLLGFGLWPNVKFFYIPNWTDVVYNHLWLKLILFFFFQPNLALMIFAPIPYTSQTWSIGVEEQFYLIWPLIIAFSKRSINWIIFVLVLVSFSYNLIVLIQSAGLSNKVLDLVKLFFTYSRFDSMAVGAFGAFLVFFKKDRILKILYNRNIQIFVWVSLLVLIVFGIKFYLFNNLIYSSLFSIIIINLATNPKNIIVIENKLFNYLGRISYGIYMYHLIVITLVLKILVNILGKGSFNILFNILAFSLTLILTIIISAISYEYFEKFFIIKKNKFTLIKSRDSLKSDSLSAGL